MVASNYNPSYTQNNRYKTRQDLVKTLLREKTDINTRATYLAVYDTFNEIISEKEERIRTNRWRGMLVFFGHNKKNSPLEINGIECEKVSGNYSVHTPQGRKQLKNYLKMNFAIRINQYTGVIEGIKEQIDINPTHIAVKYDLIPPYKKVSPRVFGFDEKARLREKQSLDELALTLNPNYRVEERDDAVGSRHLNAIAASYKDPRVIFGLLSQDCGLITFIKNRRIKWSHLKSEPVLYHPTLTYKLVHQQSYA